MRLSLLSGEEETRVLSSAQGTVVSKEQREAKRILTLPPYLHLEETRRKE